MLLCRQCQCQQLVGNCFGSLVLGRVCDNRRSAIRYIRRGEAKGDIRKAIWQCRELFETCIQGAARF